MNTKLLLIIDDDPIFRLVTRRLIHNLSVPNLSVVECENGQTGLDAYYALNERFDEVVVFLDLNMPILDGWNFLDTIRSESLELHNMSVYITSSSVDKFDKEKAQSYPLVCDFFHKPLHLNKLRALFCGTNNSSS